MPSPPMTAMLWVKGPRSPTDLAPERENRPPRWTVGSARGVAGVRYGMAATARDGVSTAWQSRRSCAPAPLDSLHAMADTVHLSQAAFDRLKAELDDLTTRGRIDIARKIESARELGDLSENGDYH